MHGQSEHLQGGQMFTLLDRRSASVCDQREGERKERNKIEKDREASQCIDRLANLLKKLTSGVLHAKSTLCL